MLYNWLYPLHTEFSFLNVFRYQSFRPGLAIGRPYYAQRYWIADPGRYGFVNATAACALVPSCIGAPKAVQNTYLSLDGVHLTDGGYLVLSRYMANAVAAPNAAASRRRASSRSGVGQAVLSRMKPGRPNSRPSEGPRPAASHAA